MPPSPLRILYLGPSRAGKRSNLRWIRAHGVSGCEATDERLALDLGNLGGVPAQLELRVTDPPLPDLGGIDGAVLVLDSVARALPSNRAACEAFSRALDALGRPIPVVVQWNKRDLPDAMPLPELELRLNRRGLPAFPGSASTGQGVLQALGALVGMILAQRQHPVEEQDRSRTVIQDLELPPIPLPAPPPTAAELIGQRIGPCRVLSKLGEGGMGAVYLAHHENLGKRVVVKTLKPSLGQDPRRVRRFFLEARAAARLDHPNIVAVQDVGTTPVGVHYIVMQHVEGEDLLRRLASNGPLSPETATRTVLAVARALEALHAAGIVHRDVKCENVIVTPDDEVKLIDFGLAKDLRAQANLTRPGALIGTPAYMAPEIGRLEDIDGRVDIYSLGLTYYHLLTGLQPFEGYPIHAVILGRGRLAPPADVIPGLHPDHTGLLARMLAWDRDQRYPSVEPLIADLEARLEGRPVSPATVPSQVFDLEAARRAMGRDPRPIPPTIPPEAGAATRRVARPVVSPTASPACFGPYRVLEAIERGRRFTLYAGWDLDGEQEVRLRRCQVGARLGASCALELRAAARFEHPRSPRLRDHRLTPEGVVLVSDRCSALPIQAADEALDVLAVTRVAADVAGVLADLHDQGLVHGSLRPSSLGIDDAGRGVLLDLDLAALRLGLATEHGVSLGAHEDAPPESRSGRRPTPRTDVHALGVALSRLLPAQGTPTRLAALAAVCACASAPRPEARYRDMRALSDDLRRVERDEVPRACPLRHQVTSVVRSARQLPPWARLAGTVLALALVVAVHVAWSQAQLAEARSRRLEAVLDTTVHK